MKLTNIQWDTSSDGEEELYAEDLNLPSEYDYIIPAPDEESAVEEAYENAAAVLSDEFGYCVSGFEVEGADEYGGEE